MRCGKVSVFYLLPCSAFLLFDESLSLMKIAGLTTTVAGIVLIKSGTRKARKPELEVNHGAV